MPRLSPRRSHAPRIPRGEIMKGPRILRSVLLLAIAIAGSTPAAAQEKSDFTFAFHGYVAGSLYYQDQQIAPSNGQQTWFVTSQANTHNRLFGGDVRTSRLNFSLAGPKVFAGATPKGVVEFDFSNNAGPGTFGDASLLPRFRLGFAELNWEHGDPLRAGPPAPRRQLALAGAIRPGQRGAPRVSAQLPGRRDRVARPDHRPLPEHADGRRLHRRICARGDALAVEVGDGPGADARGERHPDAARRHDSGVDFAGDEPRGGIGSPGGRGAGASREQLLPPLRLGPLRSSAPRRVRSR